MRRLTTFAVVPVCTISLSACHSNCIVDNPIFVSASATERTRDFCGLFPLHIAKYAANRCIYSTNLSIPFCAAPL